MFGGKPDTAVTRTGTDAGQTLAGGDFNDVLSGLGGEDTLWGHGGNDTLTGGAGVDLMRGAAGNDTYGVDNPNDVVDEGVPGSSGVDTVLSSISFSLADTSHARGSVENLTLLGGGRIAATGNALANHLTGNAGSNTLNGLGGNDTLKGGLGNDKFVFSTALGADNVDRIVGFSHKDDTIGLNNAIFARLKHEGILKDDFFHIGKHAADRNDFIDYAKKTGVLFYDADGSRHHFAPVEIAQLHAHLNLTHEDFLVL